MIGSGNINNNKILTNKSWSEYDVMMSVCQLLLAEKVYLCLNAYGMHNNFQKVI